MAMTNWYLDAWSVRDGAAFASRRHANSRDAENTVFIAVPDLEPVPVGRLSTALSATRRNFQTGLRTAEGEEVAFETLEQIAELVRRGFLAGGLGPGGAAAPRPGGRPRPPGGSSDLREPLNEPTPDGGGAMHFEAVIAETDTANTTWRSPDRSVAEDFEQLARGSDEPNAPAADAELLRNVVALTNAYAEAVTIDWETRVHRNQSPSDTRLLIEWYGALCDIGVWTNGIGLKGFAHTHACRIGAQLAFNAPVVRWAAVGAHHDGAVPRQHLLAHAPCPRRSRWVAGLTRLADKVTLPLCISDYFTSNAALPELAPAFLGATIITAGGFPSATVTRQEFRRARAAAAARWLAREIPHVVLPAEVNVLIDDYAWRHVESGPASWSPAPGISAPKPENMY